MFKSKASSYFKTIKLLCVLVAFLFLSQTVIHPLNRALALEQEDGIENGSQDENNRLIEFIIEENYLQYLEKNKDLPRPDAEIEINASDYHSVEGEGISTVYDFHGENEAVLFERGGENISWLIDVAEKGMYNVKIFYYPVKGYRSDIEFGVKINGEFPFSGARKLLLYRIWEDATKIRQDNRGNDIRPEQRQVPEWTKSYLLDSEGLSSDEYLFRLEEGENIIEIETNRAGFAISKIQIKQTEEIITYDEYKKKHEIKKYDTKDIFIRHLAQETYKKSSPHLVPLYDKSSAGTIPQSPYNLKLNIMGGMNWAMPGQWLSWKIDVPEDGFYQLAFRYRQHFMRGFFVTRNLYINGQPAFAGAENIEFGFSNNWQLDYVGDEEKPFEFFLEEGLNEIKLEVSLGKIAESLMVLDEVVFDLNDMYRQIIMITGTTPDIYRDYNLQEEIPDLLSTLSNCARVLREQAEYIESLSGQRGSEASRLETIAFQIEDIIRRPNTINQRLSSFKSNVSMLAAWVLRMKEQPLDLDYLIIKTSDRELPPARPGFFKSLRYTVESFIASFFVDYASVGDIHDEDESLRVWMFGGRDQAQIVKGMIDDLFTPETGLGVNLELVQGGLIEAILSGQEIDLIMIVNRGDPVNLAARGALSDLSQFEGFDEVVSNFGPTAMDPYEYEGGYYGLPVQQNFNMMFYRKDVLAELNVSVPDTWDDFYDIIPKIQRANMEVGIPSGAVVSQPGMPQGFDIFATLMLQNDSTFYDENKTRTTFYEQTAVEAFTEWTNFFVDYSFPIQFDFYNRFRTGEMPLAIQPYPMYNLLMVAAPEIRNLWGMAPIPGTLKDDGSIDRSAPAFGTATVILSNSDKQQQSWEFLKWWVGTQAQVRYGTELETLMGPAARYDTANVNAIKQLPWSDSELDILLKQFYDIKEIPEVTAGYFITRSINNAFREVLYNPNMNPREVLFKFNNLMNLEIERKRAEFGLD